MPLYLPLEPIDLAGPVVGSFLDSTNRLPVGFDGESGWRGGVAMQSFGTIDPGGWPANSCLTDYESDWAESYDDEFTFEDKTNTADDCTIYEFDPFTVYHYLDDSIEDGSLVATTEQQARFRRYTANWLESQLSAQIAQAFYRGAPIDGLVTGLPADSQGKVRNPIPRTVAVDLTALMDTPAAVHPTTAVATLLAAYYGCRQAGGAVLHVPPLILPFLIAHGIVAQVGKRYLGPGGVVVIADPGMPSNRELLFPDLASDSVEFPGSTIGTSFDVSDAPNQCWMFVTGPVEASFAPVREPLAGDAQLWDARRNRWVWVLEQPAIFRWDPACCFAVAVFAPSPAANEV